MCGIEESMLAGLPDTGAIKTPEYSNWVPSSASSIHFFGIAHLIVVLVLFFL
jgi:hypothetical protein